MITQPTNHPGRVTVIAPDGTETVKAADGMPDWLKFARGRDGGTVPVVLIAQVRSGVGFTFHSYGPDGRLVAVTASLGNLPVAPPDRVSGWF
ncbi:hypothetical protein [Gemmata sp.]|jgi:hypothetical protein|uniref:hypothetical protein n=1 Tax=Gemmata sp. TaxID=1914242 RepID=UPI003F72C222